MPWGLWASVPAGAGRRNGDFEKCAARSNEPDPAFSSPTNTNRHDTPSRIFPWFSTSPNESATKPKQGEERTKRADEIKWNYIHDSRNLIVIGIATAAMISLWVVRHNFLLRLPTSGHIHPDFFRTRSLLGKVTSVGDGDGFHLFHTPGGRLAGWGWLRRVPSERKKLKGKTIPIRLAGIDAPEGAHFGRPAQPGSAEALSFLQRRILGRRVRAFIYKRDQYDRVVATVFVRKPPFFIPLRDVGLEMLCRGLATTYEAKTGVEYGGPAAEMVYKAAEREARGSGRGIWAGEIVRGGFLGLGKKSPSSEAIESPRMFKARMRELDREGDALNRKRGTEAASKTKKTRKSTLKGTGTAKSSDEL